MPYHHETGSMRRYSGGYGTIDITLSNYSNLVSGTRYDYSLQKKEGGLYKGYAIAEDNGSEIVLVDSSFTLPNNPPPYQTGTEINIFNSSDGEFVLNTYIFAGIPTLQTILCRYFVDQNKSQISKRIDKECKIYIPISFFASLLFLILSYDIIDTSFFKT